MNRRRRTSGGRGPSRGFQRSTRSDDPHSLERRAPAEAPAAATGASDHSRVPVRRVAALSGLWIVALALLCVRMIDLQIVRAGHLGRLAVRQQFESVRLHGRRGVIVDRAGRPLAINVDADSVYAVPKAIDDAGTFARAVGRALGLPPAEIRARLQRGGPYFAWLARRLPDDGTAARVRALDLGPALGLVSEARRAYPAGTLAASLLGFTGTDDAGLAGLELQYDALLRGSGGIEVADHDAIGRELMQTQRIVTPPRDGATLVLTLDEMIQHIAEREIASAAERARARAGLAVVMDPQTGGILAVAAWPSFDPNRYEDAPPQRWKSPAVADVYEPGSTFKLILAAAALDSRAVTLDDRWSDPGKIRINGVTIHDAEPAEHFESLNLADIITFSSNVGAAQVATRLGKETFDAYIRQFGFGRPTGIDLPGEAAGLVRPIAEWRGPALQNIGFGQGISVTPIQLLVAVSALATDGLAARPHVVAVVRDADGRIVAAPGDAPRHRVIDAGVAAQVLAMMQRVVREGTGVKAQVDGYVVAGKTGTAQRPGPGGRYEPGAYVASFVGVVPVPSPRLAILVVIDTPRSAYFGGDVAAPVFREIARQALWYLRVPPDDTVQAASAPGSAPPEGPVDDLRPSSGDVPPPR